MAEALVHYYFFKDSLKNLDDKYKEYLSLSDDKIFLKSNTMMISKYYKSNKLHSYNYEIKNKLHNLKTKEFLKTVCEYTLNNNICDENLLMLYGIVAEYTIESYLNPFIIARSGIYTMSNKKSYKHRYNRNKLEKALDQLMFKEREDNDLLNIDLTKKFNGGFRFSFIDLNMLDYSINKVYFFPNTFALYNKSARLFRRYSKNSKYDIFKIKNVIIYVNNFLRSKFSKKFEYISPYKKLQNIDYKNKHKASYPDIVTGESKTDDFDTLYNKALEQVEIYYEAINKYIFLHNSHLFDKVFEDISIDTNTPTNKAYIKYSKSIFTNKKK